MITAFFLTVIVVSRDRIYDESTSTDVSFFSSIFFGHGWNYSTLENLSLSLWIIVGFCLFILGVLSIIFAIINISIANKLIGFIACLLFCFLLIDFYKIPNDVSQNYHLGYGWIILFLGAILNFFNSRKEWAEWIEGHLFRN